MVVVFPEPFRPRNAKTLPRGDAHRYTVDGLFAAEVACSMICQ
jgi:hypothetical protein